MDKPPRARVLIVDDDASLRATVALLLEKHGYEIREAPDALKGLRLLEGGGIDVVLLDLSMPAPPAASCFGACAAAPLRLPSSSSPRTPRSTAASAASMAGPATICANPSSPRSCWPGSRPPCARGWTCGRRERPPALTP